MSARNRCGARCAVQQSRVGSEAGGVSTRGRAGTGSDKSTMDDRPVRAIVTGSRDWLDEEPIRVALSSLPPGSTVVHGGAGGADYLAGRIARALGLHVEPHPADWRRYGKAAGGLRNAEMVDAGADLVLAFPLPDSIGTWDLVRKAKAAGIETRVWGEDGTRRAGGEG